MALFAELNRRNVFRVALLYTVAGWLILQIADVLFEQLGIPGWAFRFVFALLLICFPLVLIFSWIFEITPEGIKREEEIEAQASITAQTGRKINRITILLLILTILVVVADRLIPESVPERATQVLAQPAIQSVQQSVHQSGSTITSANTVDNKSIAVLPFLNMSGDEENEYFSDGLSEELLNSLVAIKELKVTGRTSSFAFKGKNEDLRIIGEKLNVAHILEGSVRKANNRVRITAQLVKVDDGYHLWSETFDRELDDIFAIQEEIAKQVTAALSVAILGPGDSPAGLSGTSDTDAWEAYLRGSYIFQQNPDARDVLHRAEKEMRTAIEIDPGFVKAQVGLYLVIWRQTINGFIPFDEGIAMQKQIADTAFALAPENSGVLQIMSRYYVVTYAWQKAEAAANKALEQTPGDINALNQFVNIAYFNDDRRAAVSAAEKAAKLDPLSITALQFLAYAYSIDGQCEAVEKTVQRALALEPGHSRSRYSLGMCLLIAGNSPEKALAAFKNEPLQWQRLTGIALASVALGDEPAVTAALEEMMQATGESSAYQYAMIYAYAGDTERALRWLQRAWEIKDPGLSFIKFDPFLDSIREDERFKSIQKKLGF